MTQNLVLSVLFWPLFLNTRLFSFPIFVRTRRYRNTAVILDSQNLDVSNTIADTTQSRYFQVSAAFCPLVGGPAFLPLHVSIILKQNDPKCSNEHQKAIQIPGQEVMLKNQEICHRFDFLPVNAREPQTLKKLVMLQRVQGQVRCTEYCNSTYDRPYFEVDLGATNDTLSLEDILIFCGDYQRSKGELHLITNNCFSFALELCRLLSPITER